MEERYEIRGKIGQGGLGAVYRGFDTRMNREVAIKRISAPVGDPELQEESTRQLMKEAGALASLQHPHIVTVYDVGTDEDGPYVVMELISGKTLDELIERAPLTWPDFRELAMQTQEALIAAQELDLIHSDIKPSNLMLTWLPSGKFQVKIVDFGLATLTQSQNKEDLAALEAVFGSIFFMAPEQFERSPLDARSDLYSMGCVYYQALTGHYPFDGKTGNEVMEAHLHHSVKPLQEIRSDIPLWACDWIMWHINRFPQDRPASARESLSVFLQNDKNPNPTMSLGSAQPANSTKRPRLIIPGSEPTPTQAAPTPTGPLVANPVPTAPAPTPTAPVLSAATPTAQAPPPVLVRAASAAPAPVLVRASAAAVPTAPAEPVPVVVPVETAPQPPEPVQAVSDPEPEETQNSTKTKSAPLPLTPPEGSKPSVHTSSQALPQAEPEVIPLQAAAPRPHSHTRSHVPVPTVGPPAKRKLSNSAKTAIAAILGIAVVLLGWFLLDRSGKNRENKRYNTLIQEAAKGDAVELPVNSIDLDILLRAATSVSVNEERPTIYKALFLAKATDATDVDMRIVEFATTKEMLPDVREVLIRDVLRKRKNPVVIPKLIAFAQKPSQEPRAAVAALQAVRFMAGEEQADTFLGVIETTTSDDIRKAAEETLAEIIRKSSSRADFADSIALRYEAATDEAVRHSMLRLLGRCGGPKAASVVKSALDGNEVKDKIAAIISLSAWGDGDGFPILTNFLSTNKDENLRNRAFEAALRFLTDSTITHDPAALERNWKDLSSNAKTRIEQQKVIQSLTNYDEDWSLKIIESYLNSDDDSVADMAERAVDFIKQRKRALED